MQIGHLMKMCPQFEMKHSLWKSDVYVRDKQNVDAATRFGLNPKFAIP